MTPAMVVTVARSTFGRMPDGAEVEAITFSSRRGTSATVITYGAALQALELRNPDGSTTDVALGHATLDEYRHKRQYMGSTVGRVANRISKARFVLDGHRYQITANDGSNALHGGTEGFDRAVWTVAGTRSGVDFADVELTHVSPDGDQGFPGRVTASLRYRLGEDGSLRIDHIANTDRVTVVSLLNHTYWNLAGEGSPGGAMGLVLEIPAQSFLPVDATLIPTGELRQVSGTVFDFRTPQAIGESLRETRDEQIRIGRGYDHNWIVASEAGRQQHLMARVTDPVSGRRMEVWSDQPGLQFYSGNFLDATSRGKSGNLYRQGDAIVLEPQPFPDVVNQPKFGSIRLAPGETYRSTTIYRFSVENS